MATAALETREAWGRGGRQGWDRDKVTEPAGIRCIALGLRVKGAGGGGLPTSAVRVTSYQPKG